MTYFRCQNQYFSWFSVPGKHVKWIGFGTIQIGKVFEVDSPRDKQNKIDDQNEGNEGKKLDVLSDMLS